MVLTPADVRNIQFTTVRYRPGYDLKQVDDFLSRVEAELDRLIRENAGLRAELAGIPYDRGPRASSPAAVVPSPGPLSPEDVRNAQFGTTRRGPACDEKEVDDFLGRVEGDLGWLIRENQRLRGQIAGTVSESAGPALPPGTAAGPAGGTSARATRGGQGVGCLIFFGVACCLSAIAVVLVGTHLADAGAAKSAYTQTHGVPDSASVIKVGSVKDEGLRILVRLDTPVGGQGTSTVYVPDGGSFTSGEGLDILVDPRDPSYSEFPGDPNTGTDESLISVVAGVALASCGTLCLVAIVRGRRKSRRRSLSSGPARGAGRR